MCLWELRAALRAGDVWVEGSRRYADPETYLIGRGEWPEKRSEVRRLIGAPENGAERLQERQVELESILARLGRGLPLNDYVRLVGEDLTVAPVRGDSPESAEQHWICILVSPTFGSFRNQSSAPSSPCDARPG